MCERPIEKSYLDFTRILAPKAPAPGGGGVAALVGALGMALCSMVENLTVGRKKYAEAEYDIKIMLEKAEAIQARLLNLVEEDAAVFEPLAKAYSVPKEGPKHVEFLEEVTLNACKAPLKVMECCCEAIDLLKEMMDKDSATLTSDIGCGVLYYRAALESAGMNVFVDTRTLADKNQAAETEAKTGTMSIVCSGTADRAAEEVTRRLRGVK